MRCLTSVLTFALTIGLLIMGCDSELTSPEEASTSLQDPVMSQHTGPANQAILSQQLNAVRQATKKYRDIETARADGYVAISPYVPGMGFHFAKLDEDGNPAPFGTELENPGVLVYYTNGSYNPDPFEEHDPAHDDDLILGAVEYLVPGDQEDDPPNIFNDEDSPRNLKVTEEEGWHFESQEGFTALHAWVHRGNPAGVFHPTNPTIDPQTEDDHH